MKAYLGPLLLAGTGLVLGLVAWRAEEPTYEAPRVEELPEFVPATLTGEVPSGWVVRTLDVQGMCCAGCPRKLYGALGRVGEVREAAVDHVLGAAHVVVPEGLDLAVVESALTFGKYAATRRDAELP